MSIENIVESRVKFCNDQIEKIKAKLEHMPAGELRIYANGKYFKYVKHLPGQGSISIKRTEKDTISGLIKKRALEDELHDLEVERKACLRYMRCMDKSVRKLERLYLDSNAEYKRLLHESYKSPDERVSAWIKQTYKQSMSYPKNLRISTEAGHKVRSKTERMVSNLMYSSGIPYRYEQVYMFGSREVSPDFTVLDTMTYQEKIIEIAGMMDDAEYVSKFYEKMKLYAQYGWLPDINLLILYESKDHPLNMDFARARIGQFLNLSL